MSAPAVGEVEAGQRIAALVDTLVERRWGPLDPERRRWAGALAALVLALKPRVKAHQVLSAAPADAGDLDLADTLGALANLGFTPRRETVRPRDLDPRLAPCLVRPAGAAESPWAILGRTADGGVRLYDSATGLVETWEADDPRLQRPAEAWVFKRADETASATSRFSRAGSGHSWFRALIGRFAKILLLVLASGLAINLVALSIPLFIMLVYDNVIFSGATELLPGLAGGAALAVLAELGLRRVRARTLAWLSARLDYVVGVSIFGQLTELPPADIERASVPAQIARIKTFEAVRDVFCGGAFLSAMELPFVGLSLGLIALLAGPLALVPLLFVGAYAVLFHLVRRRVKVAIRIAAKAGTARQRLLLEALEKREALRLLGLDDLWAEKHRRLSGREGVEQHRLGQLGAIGETASQALTLLAGAAAVAVGAGLYWTGHVTTGGLVASMILVWRVLAPFHTLCAMIPRLEQVGCSIEQVNRLLELDGETAVAAKALPALRGGIAFDGVRLRYGEGVAPALDRLSFEAPPGALVAVTGPSGAGKTSLLKLVKGLYAPEDGAVLLDGFDIRQLDAFELRRQIAYAPQVPAVFEGTVLENLRLANPLASHEDAERALATFDAWDVVAALPQGLDTPIAPHGPSALSADLAGLLGLARALLHDGRIVLLDEPSNALLCGRSGAALRRWLVEGRGRRTVVLVTQRDDLIGLADVVVRLAPGGAQVTRHAADAKALETKIDTRAAA